MIAAVLNHLWQSTLCVAGISALALLLRDSGAHVRYWLWLAASLKFLLPFAVLTTLGALWAPHAGLSPVSTSALPILADDARRAIAPFILSAVPAGASFPWPTVGLILWFIGAMTVVVRWSRRWVQLHALVRAATPYPIVAPVAVRATRASIEPGLVGIFAPVLLLPEQLIEALPARDLRMIVAHEICHWRRRDNLTYAFHALVQILFWFYPLTLWLGRRLIIERERACDEAVLASGHDAQAYGESLLKVCHYRLAAPGILTASITGPDLKRRIHWIMSLRGTRPLSAGQRLLLAAAAGAAVLTPLSLGLLGSPVASALASALTPGEIARQAAEQARPRKAIALNPEQFDRFIGHYELMPDVLLHVFRVGGRFYAQVNTQRAIEVFPESPGKFFATGIPYQISFAADAHGRIIALVLHHDGVLQPARRMDETAAARNQALLQDRISGNRPSPGTEAALRRWIESEERGQVDYGEMTPVLAALARPKDFQIQTGIRRLGALQSLAFGGVTPVGMDIYHARFAQGTREIYMAPLTPDGKIEMILWRTPP